MKLGDKSILWPLLAHYYRLWPGETGDMAWVTGYQVSPPPHGQPIIRCQQPLALAPSIPAETWFVNFDKFGQWQVHQGYERLIVCLSVSLFHFVQQIRAR